MTLARTERRAVVTSNLRDCRPLHAEAITPGGPGHLGMIFMPGTHRHTKQDTARIIAALEAKLASFTPLPFAAAARQPLRASCGRQRTWA